MTQAIRIPSELDADFTKLCRALLAIAIAVHRRESEPKPKKKEA